jgi:hypothetical protein
MSNARASKTIRLIEFFVIWKRFSKHSSRRA